MKLTDIKWMDKDLAERLESEGVTVEAVASASPAEFLRLYPYVGTINAWLLTSEAKYLINLDRAGLWEPDREKQERLVRELEALEVAQYRKRPEMQWPPPPRPPQQYSVRVRRIRASQGLADEE